MRGETGATELDRLLLRFPVERPPTPTAGAAVTLVLREGRSAVEVLLIERAQNPRDPASGDVGLPGGHVAEEDDSLADTAARELAEEVGIALTDLAGPLRYTGVQAAPRFELQVGVFAGRLGESSSPPLRPDPEEVAHVFWLPRTALDVTVRVHRDTPRGEIEVPATVHEGHILWGFTRKVLRQFFELPTEDQRLGRVFAAHRSVDAEPPPPP